MCAFIYIYICVYIYICIYIPVETCGSFQTKPKRGQSTPVISHIYTYMYLYI